MVRNELNIFMKKSDNKYFIKKAYKAREGVLRAITTIDKI